MSIEERRKRLEGIIDGIKRYNKKYKKGWAIPNLVRTIRDKFGVTPKTAKDYVKAIEHKCFYDGSGLWVRKVKKCLQ